MPSARQGSIKERMKPDLLAILEAGYAVDAAEQPWLTGLLAAAQPALDEGFGAFAFSYTARDSQSFEPRCLASSGFPDALVERLPMVMAHMPGDYIETARNAQACILASEIDGFDAFVPQALNSVGAYDILGINVLDPTGIGCYFGAPLPRRGGLTEARRATWGRVAAHVAAAFRIQRRFALGHPGETLRRAEAILDATGKVHHAAGPAELTTAREALRTATVAMEHARTKLRTSRPDQALDEWKGLVAARWSLVEHFESDGKRYILACENDPHVAGPSLLSPREQQVLAYASLGHSSKLIAYELGISDSTVRVLLARATTKLGARSRKEAIATFTTATTASKKEPG
jgi:DNA-binding CsgD family transcriptional regulator